MKKSSYRNNLIIFKNNLKILLDDRKEKATPLAKKINIDPTTLLSYLNEENQNFPGGEQLLKLANHFDVSVSFLLGETTARTADYTAIENELGIDDDIINNLVEIKKINSKYGNQYRDILSEITINPDIYESTIKIIDKKLNYYMNSQYADNTNQQFFKDNFELSSGGKIHEFNIDEYTDAVFIAKYLENYHKYLDMKFYSNNNQIEKSVLKRKEKELQKQLRAVKKALNNC